MTKRFTLEKERINSIAIARIYDGEEILAEFSWDNLPNLHCSEMELIVERLNQYESLMKELTTNGNFKELTGLMHDNNLNWKSVTNIIKEALP